MDANDPAQIEAVADDLRQRWGSVDGFLHAIAFAPQDALGGNFLNTPWESVGTAIQTSAYSLKAIGVGLLPLMKERGGAIVSLDFDARFAWPVYDWMGVAKASLEAVTRYLARDLGPHGIRVNTVSAGPLRTIAGKGIPGFEALADGWDASRRRSGGTRRDAGPVADTIAFLLSDLARGITGEMVHVDGGYHVMGARRCPTRSRAATDASAEVGRGELVPVRPASRRRSTRRTSPRARARPRSPSPRRART